MKSLAIREVVLTNFKNYAEARFSFGEKFNLVSGLNGIGKTNLLDAIYYMSVGKSYFTPYDQRVVRQEEAFFRLEGDFHKDNLAHKIIIKVKPGTLKELVLDHTVIPRISEHLGYIPVVFSAPRDIDLVYGSSLSRRRYMDHLLCQVDHQYLQALVKYNHLLDMRNAALKQGFADLPRIVATYDEQMAPLAALIYEKRKWVNEIFGPLLRETYLTLSENREGIDFRYESGLHEYPYAVLADMNWEADKNTGRTNAGIHKDDYKLSIKNMSAREYGSQGQVKSLIFALHLSKYIILRDQSGHKPLLILDDIFDKLDERRLQRLMEILMAPEFGQVFISDTSSTRVSSFLPSGLIHSIEM
jgi:DNA replication and repair protein RecF